MAKGFTNSILGGIGEGLYIWKKYSVLYTQAQKTLTGTEQIELGTTTSDSWVYSGTNITFDASTGLYTIVNPEVEKLLYNGDDILMNANRCYMWNSASSDKMYSTDKDNVWAIKNKNGSVLISTGIEKGIIFFNFSNQNKKGTFLGYVVSNDENEYPDGGVKGGYWYERVDTSLKYTSGKITYTTKTLTQNVTVKHGLGETPKIFYIVGNNIDASGGAYGTIKLYNAFIDNYTTTSTTNSLQGFMSCGHLTTVFYGYNGSFASNLLTDTEARIGSGYYALNGTTATNLNSLVYFWAGAEYYWYAITW